MQEVQKYKDVSTVVSILPISISEPKPGLHPGVFKIDAAKPGDFELLVVERCTHPVYLDESRPRLIVPNPSDVVANSIVQDYKISLLGYSYGVAEPGLDWVQGEFNNDAKGKSLFKGMHAAMLQNMIELQKGWFEHLVMMADDDWAKYRVHKFVTDLQRSAAISLGYTSKDWLVKERIEEALSKCRFCYTQIHPKAIVCHQCLGDQTQEKYSRIGDTRVIAVQ